MGGSCRCRKVITDFNRKYGKHITYDTVAKLTEKFKYTLSAIGQRRSGHPCTSTEEGTTDVVLDAFARSPPQKHTKVGCRKQCQQMEYNAL
jgi:hypothetical protein